jgi:D-sedoheptulose 7-phosphate isomerase
MEEDIQGRAAPMSASDNSLQLIATHLADIASLSETFFREHDRTLCALALQAAACLAGGHKLLFCGNGSGAMLAQQLAAAFISSPLGQRPALPAMALGTTGSTARDGATHTLARQVEALGHAGDMLLAIAPAADNANLVLALQNAHQQGMLTAGLTSQSDTELAAYCHTLLEVPTIHAIAAQTVQTSIAHLFHRLTDYYLFENVARLMAYLRDTKEPKD